MPEALDLVKQRNRKRARLIPLRREPHAAATRVVEFDAEVAFERLDPLRDGGLGNAELDAGFCQAAVLRHSEEAAQRLEVQHLIGILVHERNLRDRKQCLEECNRSPMASLWLNWNNAAQANAHGDPTMPSSRFRWILAATALILTALAIALIASQQDKLMRVYHVIRLFEPEQIVPNFRSMETLFHTAAVRRSETPHHFESEPRELPRTYEYQGTTRDVERFLQDTWTTGLIVLQDGKVVYEKYFRGNTAASKSISWSVAKSFISALVGIAVAEGRIADINRPVSDYVPALRDSGYDGVPVKDVLQMSSGIRFNENYGEFFSDINRLGRAIAFDTSLDEFVASLKRERAPGTFHHYVSMDTQVLGMLLRETTGETIASYLESRIWKKLGMESDAYWLVDRNGMELAFGGLNAVLRDYARLGQLYLNEGEWQGQQIIPAAWVRASVTPDAPHLQPGNPASTWVLGYGYQWWIPPQPDGDYLAIGVYGQFIYVNPKKKIVIAKTSAYPNYTVDGPDKELETIALFRAIATQLSASATEGRSNR